MQGNVEKKRIDFKKYVMMLGIFLSLGIGIIGCGQQEQQPVDTKEETEVNVEIEDSTQPTEEVKQPETEVVEVEPTEETTPEEPKVEMVDFETWATQADNDEVCLVVWNEELGIQEIMPTYQETEEVYCIPRFKAALRD